VRFLIPVCLSIALVLFLFPPYLLGSQPTAVTTKDRLVEFPEELDVTTIRRLGEWIKDKQVGRPPSSLRNIFGREAVAAKSPPRVAPPPTEEAQGPAGPVLKGFVYSRGVREAPFAAIDYEGQMLLVQVGDSVGPYRVESVEAEEGVTLVEEATGEKFQLALN
jgi:hypothetical protein